MKRATVAAFLRQAGTTSRARRVCCALVCLASLHVTARTVDTTSAADTIPSPVQVTTVAGRPVTVRWPDKREAIVVADYLPAASFKSPFKVTENLCTQTVLVECTMMISIKPINIALQWSRHPDAAKLGHIVQSNLRSGESTFVDMNKFSDVMTPVYVFPFLRSAVPKLGVGIPNDRIICRDYSWLPGGTSTTAPESLVIDHWNRQGIKLNAETRMKENRSRTGAFGVKLVRRPEGDLEISEIKHYLGVDPSMRMFHADEHALFLTVNQQPCQITLKPDNRAFIEETSAFLLAHQTHYIPYVFGSDELFDVAQFRQTLESLVQLKAQSTAPGGWIKQERPTR